MNDEIQEIGKVFNELAEGYTTMMETMVPHYRRLITSMLAELPEGFEPATILDLGCGNGNVSALCAKYYPDAQFILVDASDEMIELCQRRFSGDNFEFRKSLFQDLDLPQKSIDLAVAGFSMHHLSATEKQALMGQLAKWLQPGGVFACADLLINKSDPEHEQVIKSWRQFVLSNNHTEEDWEWLTDHYEKYDKPSSYSDQSMWLRDAGFDHTRLSWNDDVWGCFHATR